MFGYKLAAVCETRCGCYMRRPQPKPPDTNIAIRHDIVKF